MHPSSFDKMAAFRRDYLDARRGEPLVIIDLGSNDINGSYRPLFAQPTWTYKGVDVVPGENVDVVLKNPYDWREIGTASVDVVISGQTFEHTEFFWETMLEIARVLKPEGLCCIIAPSSGPVHRFPIDCWRFYPDGLRAVARYAGLEALETRTQWTDLEQYDSESNKWHDSVLIARKSPEPLRKRLRRKLRAWLNPYLSVVD
jgi:SAM-dependent methyltransferase